MTTAVIILLSLVTTKALTIGSEFNFFAWFRHGKRYTHWYFNREGFKP